MKFLSPVTAQPGLCQNWSEPQKPVFSVQSWLLIVVSFVVSRYSYFFDDGGGGYRFGAMKAFFVKSMSEYCTGRLSRLSVD